MKLFGVIFELSGVLYLYRDFITVLAKIGATVTLMDKTKSAVVTLMDKTKSAVVTLMDKTKSEPIN